MVRPSAWLARFAGKPRANLEMVRIVVAAIVVTHPLYDVLHPTIVSELGRATRPALGPALGVALAWAGVIVQLVASAALLARRHIVPSCAALVVVWASAALLFQWPD